MSDLDPDEVGLFAFQVWNYKMGEMVSLMIHLGDRLGLYQAMAGAGPLTVDQVVEATDYHPRWILEWLRGQTAAGLLEHRPDRDTYELTPVGAAVLADEDHSLAFAAGAFSAVPGPDFADRLAEAFTTGIGMTFDEQGPSGAHRTARMLGPWSRLAFVPVVIPALEGVQAKLVDGATVADVGCGAGVALRALAAAFPASTFHGYDPSAHALDLARTEAAADGLDNIEWILAGGEELPTDGRYDFIYTFDCIHDMTRPGQVIDAIATALADDGTWLIKDIRSTGDFEQDRNNPMLAMMYGFSVSSCMSSAMSEPGGAGLGTVGFSPPVAEQMVREAGFTRFVAHDFEDPANLYYEVRR
ncbi:MAG: class I SAM-dependent methyltransferase [Acidimicrobiales bacterium]